MRLQKLVVILGALALLVTPASARAEGFVSPFIGATFGGDTEHLGTDLDNNFTFGFQAGTLGDVFGFEFDFGLTPDFFGESATFGDNNVTTFMGNLIVSGQIAPADMRVYGTGGLGLLRSKIGGPGEFFDVDDNSWGFNLGGGVMGYFSRNVGVRGDIRYFRSLSGGDDEFDLDVGEFDFWRGTVGAIFRF